MNDKFDELAKGMAQSVTRALLCLAVAAQFASPARAEDLYVNAAAASSGDGSAANPYWRIGDAVSRARTDRQNAATPADETIVIHVAPGTYMGSFDSPGANKQLELLPVVLNMPNVVLSGATVLALDGRGLPTGVMPGTRETILASTDPLDSYKKTLVANRSHHGWGCGRPRDGNRIHARSARRFRAFW